MGVEHVGDLRKAARVVADAETVWWCEDHRSEGSEPVNEYAICWYAGNTLALNQRANIERCRMVERLLVDPGKLQ